MNIIALLLAHLLALFDLPENCIKTNRVLFLFYYRFGHTPPTAPSFATLGPGGRLNTSTNGAGNAGRSEEQLSFLSPPPAYDQLSQAQQQQLHNHYQAVQQQHSIYGTHVGTLQHAQHLQQQQQQQHHHQQHQQQQQHAQLMAQQQAQHPNAIGHYVVSSTFTSVLSFL